MFFKEIILLVWFFSVCRGLSTFGRTYPQIEGGFFKQPQESLDERVTITTLSTEVENRCCFAQQATIDVNMPLDRSLTGFRMELPEGNFTACIHNCPINSLTAYARAVRNGFAGVYPEKINEYVFKFFLNIPALSRGKLFLNMKGFGSLPISGTRPVMTIPGTFVPRKTTTFETWPCSSAPTKSETTTAIATTATEPSALNWYYTDWYTQTNRYTTRRWRTTAPTAAPTTTTTTIPTPNLSSLDWLSDVLYEGFINVPQGPFKYKETGNFEKTGCFNAPLKGQGDCVLLANCPQIYHILVDVNVYSKHFCALPNRHAGVCCPA